MQYWKRTVGDITVVIEDDGTQYLAITIDDGWWPSADVHTTRHDLQRMVDEIQGYLDGN